MIAACAMSTTTTSRIFRVRCIASTAMLCTRPALRSAVGGQWPSESGPRARLYAGSASDVAARRRTFEVFNWLRSASRRLTNADLFRDDSDWRRGVLDLYRKRLGAAADGLSDDDLAPWVDRGYIATSSGITLISHWGRSRAEPPLPDVVLAWADLRPWLSATAP
jgi:hypothetical protein